MVYSNTGKNTLLDLAITILVFVQENRLGGNTQNIPDYLFPRPRHFRKLQQESGIGQIWEVYTKRNTIAIGLYLVRSIPVS